MEIRFWWHANDAGRRGGVSRFRGSDAARARGLARVRASAAATARGEQRRARRALAVRQVRAAPEVRRGVGAERDAAKLASLSALSLGLHQADGLVFRRQDP